MFTTFSRYAGRSILDCYRFDCLPNLNLSISLSDMSLVGAALSRECIAHECRSYRNVKHV